MNKLYNMIFIGSAYVGGKLATITASGFGVHPDRISAINSFAQKLQEQQEYPVDYQIMEANEVNIVEHLSLLRKYGLLQDQ